MLATVSPVCVQAPSAMASPANTSATRGPRSRNVLAFIAFKSSPASIGNEAVSAAIILMRLGSTAGRAIEAIDRANEVGLRIGRRRKSIVGTRQVLLRHRADHIGCHQHHELGLAVEVVAAAEQRA